MLIKLRNEFYQVECALSSFWQQNCLTFNREFVTNYTRCEKNTRKLNHLDVAILTFGKT